MSPRRGRRWAAAPAATALLVLHISVARAAAAAGACRCDLKDNKWAHRMSDLLRHVQRLPNTLLDPQHESTQWVLRASCDETALMWPNTELQFDLQAVGLSDSDGKTRAQLCLPGQVALAMVCAQQWLVKRSPAATTKWVGRMAELLPIVRECMDFDSPLPLRMADLEAYANKLKGQELSFDGEDFVTRFAFEADAKLKTYEEAVEPWHECLPLKDPLCFPEGSSNFYESCAECCHPKKGTRGEEQCWVGPFTYERCCHQSLRPPPSASGEASEARARELVQRTRALSEELRTCGEERERQANALQEQQSTLSTLNESLSRALVELGELREERDRQAGSLLEQQSTIGALNESLSRALSEHSALRGEAETCRQQAQPCPADLGGPSGGGSEGFHRIAPTSEERGALAEGLRASSPDGPRGLGLHEAAHNWTALSEAVGHAFSSVWELVQQRR